VSFRLAAYAVCIEDDRLLLARYVSPTGATHWTLLVGIGGRGATHHPRGLPGREDVPPDQRE
jgi:hypothetical protein